MGKVEFEWRCTLTEIVFLCINFNHNLHVKLVEKWEEPNFTIWKSRSFWACFWGLAEQPVIYCDFNDWVWMHKKSWGNEQPCFGGWQRKNWTRWLQLNEESKNTCFCSTCLVWKIHWSNFHISTTRMPRMMGTTVRRLLVPLVESINFPKFGFHMIWCCWWWWKYHEYRRS